jgi:hypothetical protein
MRRRPKKQPVGWMGPSEGRGSGTSLGKGHWRVIDSTGQSIAAGFTSRAYALRWIDGFHLLRAGYCPDDEQWILAHWYPALPARLAPKRRASTESSKASVLTPEVTETKAWAAAGDCRNKSGRV